MRDLKSLIEIVSEKLAEIDKAAGPFPAHSGEAIGEWHGKRRVAFAEVAAYLSDIEGARFSEASGSVAVRIAGLRASSAMGAIGALRNWLAAAQKRLNAGEDTGK